MLRLLLATATEMSPHLDAVVTAVAVETCEVKLPMMFHSSSCAAVHVRRHGFGCVPFVHQGDAPHASKQFGFQFHITLVGVCPSRLYYLLRQVMMGT